MSSYAVRPTPGDSSWYVEARFGMFIHFGIYSMPARHEWVKSQEKITEEKYDKYFKYFNPDLYDAKEWAKQAKEAGMKYAVLTTKHHDGFCLFDSKYTDYKATNTPCGRDIVKEYADAFRAEGIHVGLYYSLIDWHHPDFTIDVYHPRRDDPDVLELNQGRDMKRYREYMFNQIEELMTGYGKIDILWLDFSYPWMNGKGDKAWMRGKDKDDWEAEKLLARVRELQPGILIDDRAGIEADMTTPEQIAITDWPRHKITGERVLWEICQTFSGSWGYARDEMSWKSPEMLIQMLVNAVSYGGNLLMNVGPNARGCFDQRAKASLKAFADWMKYNSRSIYGCTMAEPGITAPADCRYTQSEDGKRLYLHMFAYPYHTLLLPELAGKVDYAQFLHDGSEILFSDGVMQYPTDLEDEKLEGNPLVLYLPAVKPDQLVPVIELFLK